MRLGTRLRHLLELLDGDVEEIYRQSGMADYRPRYTPIVRALIELGPCAIKDIAAHAGISHSAVSQTVAQMRRAQLLSAVVGTDARARVISMTALLEKRLPALQNQWRATAAAATTLDAELSGTFGAVIEQAIAALEKTPFRERIRARMPDPLEESQ